jgi:hypothetical protein
MNDGVAVGTVSPPSRPVIVVVGGVGAPGATTTGAVICEVPDASVSAAATV